MRKVIISLFAIWLMIGMSYAQSLNASQTKLRNEIKSFIQEEGFLPSIDKDGDIVFKREGNTYWVTVSEDDVSPMFVSLCTLYNRPERYSLQTMLLAAAEINKYPGVKMVCFEDSFTLQGELFLSQSELFKYAFYTILNQINNILSHLSELVDEVESEVSQVSPGSSSSSSSYMSSADPNPKVVSYPSIRSKGDNKLIFKRVTITDTYTMLEMSSNNNHGDTSYAWCQISRNAHLICRGKNYSLIRAEGIKLAPEKTYYSGTNSSISFTLYFQPIPKNAATFDFYEEPGSSWNTWEIAL